GDQIFLADPGDYVLKPRGIPHTFWNPTDKPARLIEIISPAGFEKFFAEAGELFGKGRPDLEKIQALDRKSTRLNSSHVAISYAVFCLKKNNSLCNQNI